MRRSPRGLRASSSCGQVRGRAEISLQRVFGSACYRCSWTGFPIACNDFSHSLSTATPKCTACSQLCTSVVVCFCIFLLPQLAQLVELDHRPQDGMNLCVICVTCCDDAGRFQEAIAHYSAQIHDAKRQADDLQQLHPHLGLLYCNRALAHLKLKQFFPVSHVSIADQQAASQHHFRLIAQ